MPLLLGKPVMEKTVRTHLLGFLVVSVVALLLHFVVLPILRLRVPGIRNEPLYWLALIAALVPVFLWLIPRFSRGLARGTYEFHRRFFGKKGTYVRLPMPEPVRFRDTVLLALGPFAIDLFVISEILYLLGPTATTAGRLGSAGFLFVLVLAGFLTSLLPGAWLLDALELRLINPSRGEVVRPAEIFERTVGPAGALFLLASYVTLLHTSENLSYDRALFELGLWAVRLFPAVLGAVCVYRLLVEPRVLPALHAWCAKVGIVTRSTLPTDLKALATPTSAKAARGPAEDAGFLLVDEPHR
jgi:hypothetical protein